MIIILIIGFICVACVATSMTLYLREIDREEYYRKIDTLSHGYYDEVED